MELLNGDRPTPTGAVQSQENLTSFPVNFKYEIPHLGINPPNPEFLQLNHSGPSFTEFSSSQDLEENLLGCGYELGFLAQLASQEELFKTDSLPYQNGGAAATKPRKDTNAAECRDITSHGRFWELELSSSDDDSESPNASKEALNQKKRTTKMQIFLQNLISQVTQKQDQMHKQLMDIVEKKEQERIILEEIWKKQEDERAKADEEERKQETLRSLALISFIQKVCYHDVEMPYSSESSYGTAIQNHDHIKDESSNRRWPKTEVQALITVRMAIDRKFLVKGSGWKEVAAGLANMGYNRTPEKCREKWENINKYYKRTMESGKKRHRSLPYFDELDLIYKRGLLTQGNSTS